MKTPILLALLVAALASISVGGARSASTCVFGRVQGFASLRSTPPYLVGTIPSQFTSDDRYFAPRKFNCQGSDVFVRRVDLGVYEVKFPGLVDRMAVVSAVSQEGVTASVYPFANGVFRVALRGPLVSSEVASRRDVPFSIVVY